MTEFIREHNCIDSKAAHVIQIIFPGNAFNSFVYFISCFCGKMLDGFQDADSRAQAKVSTIHHCFVTSEGDHSASDFDISGSQFGEFLCQYFFQPLEGFGD